MSTAVSTDLLDRPGARITFDVRGSGPLLVLAGSPMGAGPFGPLASLFADDHTVVAHEPPLEALLPDAAERRTATDEIVRTDREHGPAAAWGLFLASAGLPAVAPEEVPERTALPGRATRRPPGRPPTSGTSSCTRCARPRGGRPTWAGCATPGSPSGSATPRPGSCAT